MQLRELNLSNSILNSELRELEAMSPKWARLHYRVLQLYSSNNTLCGTECTCKSATSKYGMHLQKCNLKIWNSPLWAPSMEENGPIIPKWAEKTIRKALVEGECEFLDVYVPDSHPTPSSILLVLGFLFLVYFWSGRSSPSRRSLGFSLCCIACI